MANYTYRRVVPNFGALNRLNTIEKHKGLVTPLPEETVAPSASGQNVPAIRAGAVNNENLFKVPLRAYGHDGGGPAESKKLVVPSMKNAQTSASSQNVTSKRAGVVNKEDLFKAPSAVYGLDSGELVENKKLVVPSAGNAQPSAPADDDDAKGNAGGGQYDYGEEIYNVVNEILNREKFSYDLDADAFYQQYADKYIQQGKLAMQDTMGQAAAMTGGYGNSYAQTAGQQAYYAQLDKLNDIAPELYQNALDKYTREGDALYDKLSMLNALDEKGYQRYLDELDNDRYKDETAYERGQDAIARDQWFLGNGFVKDEKGNWYLPEASDGGEGLSWINTGTVDENGYPIYYNSEGKTISWGENTNPYTGSVNPDTKNGTFDNGYQPDNIGGHKLEPKTDDKGLPMYYGDRPLYTLNGRTYIWDDFSNRYQEANITD